uniref:Uncharacterized protein n=1 Tax=Anguilla anguilla TaxID=7936 RepID=A0A0E9TZV7_ANGAN
MKLGFSYLQTLCFSQRNLGMSHKNFTLRQLTASKNAQQ